MLTTRPLLAVAEVMLDAPNDRHYALGLAVASEVDRGSLHGILVRLLEAGWIADAGTERGAGKPRRYFRLTALGKLSLTTMVERDRQRRARLTGVAG